MYQVMYDEPRVMSANGLHMLQLHMVRFLHFWTSYGGHLVAKHHMAFHLVERAAVHGESQALLEMRQQGRERQQGHLVLKSQRGAGEERRGLRREGRREEHERRGLTRKVLF